MNVSKLNAHIGLIIVNIIIDCIINNKFTICRSIRNKFFLALANIVRSMFDVMICDDNDDDNGENDDDDENDDNDNADDGLTILNNI